MFLFRQVLLLVLVAGICWGYHLPEETNEDYETREERNISPSRNNNGRCLCNTRYIPFCGTDGVTYSNKCQLECAQNSKPGLRVKFEGVCAKAYIPSGSGNVQRPGQGGRGVNPIYGSLSPIRTGENGKGINPIYNTQGRPTRPGEGGRGINPVYNNANFSPTRPGEGGRGINPIYNNQGRPTRPGEGGRGINPIYGNGGGQPRW